MEDVIAGFYEGDRGGVVGLSRMCGCGGGVVWWYEGGSASIAKIVGNNGFGDVKVFETDNALISHAEAWK